jgi:uncharacterized protein YktB (UPF0637 family)
MQPRGWSLTHDAICGILYLWLGEEHMANNFTKSKRRIQKRVYMDTRIMKSHRMYDRSSKSANLADEIAAFIARGGKIKKLPCAG